MRLDKAHIQKTLTETVLTLCQTGIPFDAELTVEGLLGITLDKDNVILVNIKEVIRHDMPKDYSTKGSEKRKAQTELEPTNKRQKEAPKRMQHSFIPEGYNSQEDSQDGSPRGCSGASSLKIPLIPPEYVHAASQMVQMRQKHVTDIRQKHSEISRILAVSNLPPSESPRSSTSSSDMLRCSPEIMQLPEAHTNKDGKSLPQSVVNLSQDYISPTRPQGPFGPPMDLPVPIPINLENRPDRPRSGISPMMMPTDLSVHAPSPRNMNQMVFPGDIPCPPIPTSFAQTPRSLATSQPIGVVLDTNVQPPAPLAVVAGTGVLQPVTSMNSKPEQDFYKDLPEGTAVVQPVEIVPEEDIRSSKPSGVKREKNNAASKKEKMGRPKKSKEFCRFRCTICNAASSRKFNLQRHVNSHHPNATNCIIDLTPPKNPRQIRPKGQGDMKFHNYDSSMYGMPTPEGVSLDSAMDLSISPSPDKMMYGDDGGNATDTTEELTPLPMAVVGGTGVTTVIDENERATTPINAMHDLHRSPIKSVAMDTHNSSPDAKKRFAKNKKSLDNMLFNKFGKYHNFSDDDANKVPSPDEARNTCTPNADVDESFTTDADDESNKTADDTEANDNEVELVLEGDNRTDEMKDKEDTEEMATENDDAAGTASDEDIANVNTHTPEKQVPEEDLCGEDSPARRSDASDSIQTDANANNKNDMAVTQSKFSPDVNGNSKSKQPLAAEPTASDTHTPESTSTKESIVLNIANELADSSDLCTELNEISAVKTDTLDKLSDMAMLDCSDPVENESNELLDDVTSGKSLTTSDTVEQKSAMQEQNDALSNNVQDSKKLKSAQLKDSARVTRRSVNSNTEIEQEESSEVKDSSGKNNTPLSPRRGAPNKAPLREPIKTRTSTRSSSITTRRSSMREEVDAK